MRLVAHNEANEVEVARAGGIGLRRDYIGSPGLIEESPQAFYVDRLYPEARIDPHFHDVDQFQVVVAGHCRMGKKEAAPITFQYADAYTPYGPIVGGKEGFAFFTLRPVASGGFFAMPGNRHKMPGRAGRNIAGRLKITDPLPASGKTFRESLMNYADDGVMAMGLYFGPNACAEGPASTGGGQYYLVCDGALEVGDKRMARQSLIHVEPGEAAPSLCAGINGAAVMVLQFARPSVRPGSNPHALATRDPNDYVQRPEGSGR